MSVFLTRNTVRIGSYAALLLTLTTFLFVYSVTQEQGISAPWLTQILFPIILFTTMSTAARSRSQLRALIGLFLVVLVLDVLRKITGERALEILSHAGHLIFLLFTVWVILAHVFRESAITPDMILGSVCAYLLLGLFFNEAYALVETLIPGSFGGRADVREDGGYFSLVTLSSLGYGDVVPTKAVARSIAALQAVAGQFYIAVIVARLVASRMATLRDEATTRETDS